MENTPSSPPISAPKKTLSTTTPIYNSNTALYLDVVGFPFPYPALDNNNLAEWTLNSINFVYFFQSPLELSTPYEAFVNLSYNGGSPYMDTYPSANSVMYAVQDTSNYWLISPFNSTLGTTLYLRTNSDGVLSFSSTLNDSARWTRASDGTNYKFNNKNYSTLYLQAMANGNIVQASAYNGSFANQYDWTMTSATVVYIGINGVSGQYIAYDPSGPFLSDDNGTGIPINAIYYWIERPITGSSTNFYYESVSSGGNFITADGVDGIPVFNGSFEYVEQTNSTQNWQLQ